MFEVGRICVKIAGRDAGLKCVVVDIIDNNFVLIDGQTRRRKCNVRHLEPLKESIKIKKDSAHALIVDEFKKLKIDIIEKKSKKAAPKPLKQRKVKEKPVVDVKESKVKEKKTVEQKVEVKEEIKVKEDVTEKKKKVSASVKKK